MKRLFLAILKALGYVLGALVFFCLWNFLCGFFEIENDGLIMGVLCFSLLVVGLYLEDE
jgi:hypothetical protein